MAVDWLADVLRDAGLTVIELGHWRNRGRSLPIVARLIGHDTVTPMEPAGGWSHAEVDNLLIGGRSDLAGPLANSGLGVAGEWRLVAAGRANHNGYGAFGNSTIGVEVYCAGGLASGPVPWNDAQRASFTRGAAAICRHLGWPASHVLGHKESDPARKIDPWGVEMGQVRADVSRILAGDDLADPQPIYQPPEDDEMVQLWQDADNEGRVALVHHGEGGVTAWQQRSAKELDRGRFFRVAGYERVVVSTETFDVMRAQAIAGGGFYNLDGTKKQPGD